MSHRVLSKRQKITFGAQVLILAWRGECHIYNHQRGRQLFYHFKLDTKFLEVFIMLTLKDGIQIVFEDGNILSFAIVGGVGTEACKLNLALAEVDLIKGIRAEGFSIH